MTQSYEHLQALEEYFPNSLEFYNKIVEEKVNEIKK